VFCKSLFVRLTIVLPVLQFTDSDCPFGIQTLLKGIWEQKKNNKANQKKTNKQTNKPNTTTSPISVGGS
jgi:hypothetical protein